MDKIVPSSETFDCATSFGLGAVITHAVESGCNEIYLALGGSGSSDGGLGLLQSFGFNEECFTFSFPEGWEHVRFVGLTDVNNPYAGENGFSKIFGEQKGGSAEQLVKRDRMALEFESKIKGMTGIDLQEIPGTGAAGGLGAAVVLLGGRLESGFDQISKLVGLENSLADADLVITGEGHIDSQSKGGKVPYGVAQLAKKHNVPVIALCGAVSENVDWIWDDFLAVYSIQLQVLSLKEAMETKRTESNLEFVVRNVLRTFLHIS